MSVIRAYGMENEMVQEFDRLQDVHTAPCFTLKCGIDGWQALYVNVVVSIFLTVTLSTAMIMDKAGGILNEQILHSFCSPVQHLYISLGVKTGVFGEIIAIVQIVI